LINLNAWSELPIKATHFEIESEVLLHFVLAGLPVDFVPIRVIYKAERSKIHPLRDTLRWFRWWSQAQDPFPRVQSTRVVSMPFGASSKTRAPKP